MNRKDILEEAIKCVCGDREEDYGRPEDNFATIAKLWSAYFNGVFDYEFSPKDVAMMMALMKIARIKAGTKADSYVDLAGYAACAGEVDKPNTENLKEWEVHNPNLGEWVKSRYGIPKAKKGNGFVDVNGMVVFPIGHVMPLKENPEELKYAGKWSELISCPGWWIRKE